MVRLLPDHRSELDRRPCACRLCRLGIAPLRAHRRFAAARQPQLRVRQSADVHAGLCPPRWHRAAPALCADVARLHGDRRRARPLAGRVCPDADDASDRGAGRQGRCPLADCPRARRDLNGPLPHDEFRYPDRLWDRRLGPGLSVAGTGAALHPDQHRGL